jgi:protein SCO1/2
MKSLIMACALALAAGPTALAQSQAVPAQPPQAAPSSLRTTPAPGEVGIDEKLGARLPLDLTLNDEDGRPVALRTLLDKPTVLTLNYFRCAGICTPQLNGMVDVLNQIQAQPGQDFQVLTVSFDPRDTPEVAQQKRANYLKQVKRPISPTAWRFLTGPGEATKALADSVGFKFKAQGDDFIHPAALMLLSPGGKVTRYIYGISYQPADLQMAVLEAAQGETRPTVNQWLQFCFSYDPQGRGYVFSVTRVAATIILLSAAGFAAVLLLRRKPKVQS